MKYPHMHVRELAILMQSEGEEETAAALGGMADAMEGAYFHSVGSGPTIRMKTLGAKLGHAVRAAKEWRRERADKTQSVKYP